MKNIYEIIKKSWLVVVVMLIWLLLLFIIYKQTGIQISDKIQAWAIVTLVFVTFFYAVQTQKLVKQEKASLDEQKEKKSADFWEKRLKEFYLPLKKILLELQVAVKFKPFSTDPIMQSASDFLELISKSMYVTSFKLNDLINSLGEELAKFSVLKRTDKIEEEWAEEVYSKSQEIINEASKEIALIESKIYWVYGFINHGVINNLNIKIGEIEKNFRIKKGDKNEKK